MTDFIINQLLIVRIVVGLFGMISASILTILFGIENVQQIFVTATLVPTMISYLIQLHTLYINLKSNKNSLERNTINNNNNIIERNKQSKY
jgi:hypothetical protein